MKSVKVILLVSFILGLLLFQVKFVTDNDNLNLKADISISQKANANPEAINPKPPTGSGVYTPNPQSVNCGWNQIDTWEYFAYDDWGWLVSVGTKVKINGEIQYPYYNGPYVTVTYTPSTQQIMGQLMICEAGGINACSSSSTCP